eukprot:3941504-Rhodomonas_salina.2
MSGTELAHGAVCLRATRCPVLTLRMVCVRAMRCPVLTLRMVGQCASSRAQVGPSHGPRPSLCDVEY